MSSKLLTGDEAAACDPMTWTVAGPSGQFHSGPTAARGAGYASRQHDPHAGTAGAEQEVDQIRAVARAEGESSARQQAQAELQPVLQKLAQSIQESAELRGRLREQAEADLVRLAIAIARKIVGREVNTDPEAIAGLVKASLERLRIQEVLRVRIHPEYRSKVIENLARLGASNVEVLGDPACERGAVVFETSRGNLDASVETQLREIERGLTDRFIGKR